MKLQGKAKLLRVHFGENDKWRGRPLYEAIVKKCRELDIAGATVYRGLEGYGASTLIRHSRMLSRDGPVIVAIVDTEEKINTLIPALDEMVSSGLIATSDVEIIRYVHEGGKRSPAPG